MSLPAIFEKVILHSISASKASLDLVTVSGLKDLLTKEATRSYTEILIFNRDLSILLFQYTIIKRKGNQYLIKNYLFYLPKQLLIGKRSRRANKSKCVYHQIRFWTNIQIQTELGSPVAQQYGVPVGRRSLAVGLLQVISKWMFGGS